MKTCTAEGLVDQFEHFFTPRRFQSAERLVQEEHLGRLSIAWASPIRWRMPRKSRRCHACDLGVPQLFQQPAGAGLAHCTAEKQAPHVIRVSTGVIQL